MATEKDNKNGEKDEEAEKPKAALAPSIKDDDGKSKELQKDVKSNELKKSCQRKETN